MENGQERKDRWTSSPVTGPSWFACLEGEILAANTEPLNWRHLMCRHCIYKYLHTRFDLINFFPTIIKINNKNLRLS